MTDIALRDDYTPTLAASFIPEAARGLVEWAQSARAAHSLAESLCRTSFVPAAYRDKPAEATAAMLAGAEMGLSPMASLRAFDMIQGVAAPRALTLRAVLQSQGHQIVIDEQSPTKAKGRAKRKGDNEWQHSEWTIQRAQQLGVTGKDNWKKQPQAMLVARVTSELARLIAADAILGIGYSAEELLDDQPDPTTTVTRAAEPKRTVQRRKPEPAPDPEPEFDDPIPSDDPLDEFMPGGSAAPEPITEPQSKKLHAQFRENEMDRDAGLQFCSRALGRDITTTKDLTKLEASQIIEALGDPS